MLQCRACDSVNLVSIIPLGELPLANSLLLTNQSNEERYNLEVMLCKECGLAQLKDLVDPVKLFSDYVYFSSNSETMLQSVAELVQRIITTLPKDPFIVEIASNDGYLLKNYHGFNILGIDPAANIAEYANTQGINTMCAFFSKKLAQELVADGKKADIIHANNVMAHVPDINDFIAGLKCLLNTNGRAIIEVPHFLELVRKLEFDTIYHEHVYYFSLQSLKSAFSKHGLEIFDVETISIHGGSLRVFVGHAAEFNVTKNVISIIQQEQEFNLHNPIIFQEFMHKLNTLKSTLNEKLNVLKKSGVKIAAYGASAKGTTLLNYFNVESDLIEFVVDRSKVKQGKYTPGLKLEIKDPVELIKNQISHALLLSWNFAEEIIRQQKEFIANGGKFIIPLPHVEICP